jgi:hypothetical protein
MIDTANRGSVTKEQFLTAAKECLQAEKQVHSNDQDVIDVLRKVQQYLKSNYQVCV